MPSFCYQGNTELAFLDEGDGEPIILVHGFASNKEVNWVHPGWISTLVRAGRRAIALDNRGHGHSVKFYEPSAYHTDRMVEDVCALLDHLGLKQADVMGYSMGAQICAFLAAHRGERVRSVILGGLGSRLIEGGGQSQSIAVALEAPALTDVADPVGRKFRLFAEQTNSDLQALAACYRGSRQTLSPMEAKSIGAATLIAVGTRDEMAGSPQALAKLIPGAIALELPGRDHMLAVGDKLFKARVLEFIRHPG